MTRRQDARFLRCWIIIYSPLFPLQLPGSLDETPESLSVSVTIRRNSGATSRRHLVAVVEPAVPRQS
jgi:hypothetical protein